MPQLLGSEASTTQVLELISQRRLQETQECPGGFVRIDGMCRPAPSTADQNAANPSTAAVSKKKEKYTTRNEKDSAASQAPLELTPEKSNFGAWAEAFADYEKRTGSVRSTQRAVGTMFGIDRTFRVNNWGVQLGVIGGYSHIRQDSRSSQHVEKDTDFVVSDETADHHKFGDQGPFLYTLPAEHLIDTSTRQTLDGLSLGFSGSFSKNRFYWDWLGKVAFFNLRGVISGSERVGTLSSPYFQSNTDGKDVGCINVTTSTNNQYPTDPKDANFNLYTISNPNNVNVNDPSTGTLTPINKSVDVDLRNYVLASNFGARYELSNGVWLQPSTGITYTYSDYDSGASALGLNDGYALRLEAGTAVGRSQLLGGGAIWTNAFGAYVYSDVLVDGLVITSESSSFDSDEGKVRLRGVIQSRIDFANGVSAYGEFGARVGEDYWGYSGKLGGRIEW